MISQESKVLSTQIFFHSDSDIESNEKAQKKLMNLFVNSYLKNVNAIQIDSEKAGHIKIALPIHSLLKKCIRNVQITEHDSFVLIEADPQPFVDEGELETVNKLAYLDADG